MKSLLTLFNAIQFLNDKDSSIERIIYIRANVDNLEESSLGALPGDLNSKIKPLAYPVLDNLFCFMKECDANLLIDEGKIEVLPLSMLRGRSLNYSFIIVDECQNTSPKTMKTILTRLGQSSKMVLIGDTTQCDTKLGYFNNGLSDLISRLSSLIKSPRFDQYGEPLPFPVGLIPFSLDDIIRNESIKWILNMYDS